ncbi:MULTISPECIES: YxiJ family protein [Anoxybacillaceae]|nr:hypothetical protein GRQ40_10075 [Anoxybacillus sp. PDR2]
MLYKDFFALYPHYEPLRNYLNEFSHFFEELKVLKLMIKLVLT